jgi:hypothetical protein
MVDWIFGDVLLPFCGTLKRPQIYTTYDLLAHGRFIFSGTSLGSWRREMEKAGVSSTCARMLFLHM